MTDDLSRLLTRELEGLRRSLEAFPDEAAIWRTVPGIGNSAGNLALHMCGNLRHFVGALLGGSGYVRDRDAEFAQRDVPRAKLLAEIDATIADVRKALGGLPAARLDEPFPTPVANVTLPTGRFLMHLSVHLGYHLGQLDYLRRAITGAGATPGMIAPAVLA